MPRYRKLSKYVRMVGATDSNAAASAPGGALISNTMIVMRMAMTPSLNASIRVLFMAAFYRQDSSPRNRDPASEVDVRRSAQHCGPLCHWALQDQPSLTGCFGGHFNKSLCRDLDGV